MIATVGRLADRPVSSGNTTNPLNELVGDTKRIFEVVRRRKVLLARNLTLQELPIIREEHKQLIAEEDQLVRRHPHIQHGSGGSLRSFFIRFRFRLAELDQQPGHPSERSSSQFLAGLDQLIHDVLQHDPIDTGRFLRSVFEYYRQGLVKKMQGIEPVVPLMVVNSKIETLSTLSPLSPGLSPTRKLIRVLSCNEKLMHCWDRQGRKNYEHLQIDPTLKQIYFFTRTQECNAALMYEDMMERNRGIQAAVQIYDKQYKRFQSWSRIFSQQRNGRRHTRKQVETTETKQRSKSRPKIALAPRQQKINNKQIANRTAFGRTMFRIRPNPQRPPKLSEPSNILNQTLAQFGKTPRKDSRPPTTIRIEFRSIREISRG